VRPKDYCGGGKMMESILVDILTDRFFETNEEELMHILGRDSIVNLWRVYEERDELEKDHALRRKFGIEGVNR